MEEDCVGVEAPTTGVGNGEGAKTAPAASGDPQDWHVDPSAEVIAPQCWHATCATPANPYLP
jgi:hypothetical protein